MTGPDAEGNELNPGVQWYQQGGYHPMAGPHLGHCQEDGLRPSRGRYENTERYCSL